VRSSGELASLLLLIAVSVVATAFVSILLLDVIRGYILRRRRHRHRSEQAR
jgi:hypothetical protein